MNLEFLRAMRMKRIGVKAAGHSGQKRIFLVLNRATRKFPGNVALWLQYIEYAKRQKSLKKLSQIFSTVLRLHPTTPELWILAANYALIEREDVTEARSYLQRGLRFRRQSKDLWIEFARLEMVYISQISRRSRVLGVQGDSPENNLADFQDDQEDLILLPAKHDSSKNLDSADQRALKALNSSPALSGAIPKAVYDGAMAEFPQDAELNMRFFDLFADHVDVSCASKLCRSVLDDLVRRYPANPETWSCQIRLPFVGIDPTGPDFPAALVEILATDNIHHTEKRSIDDYYRYARSVEAKFNFASRTLSWIAPYLLMDGIDDACVSVIRQTAKHLWGHCQFCIQNDAVAGGSPRLDRLRRLLHRCGIAD